MSDRNKAAVSYFGPFFTEVIFMKCISCGAPLDDENAIFCEKCYKENVAKNAGDVSGENKRNGGKKPRDDKNKTKKIIFAIIAVVVSIILGIVIWAVSWGISALNKVDRDNLSGDLGIASDADLPFDDNVKNIALFGLDTRQDNDKGRSDAIIILSIDKVNKSIKMTSIARDTYIEFENGKHDKITHAWAYGKANLAVKTINHNFKLDITDYVSVNFYQFSEIIDYIGGVTIDVSESEMKVMNTHYIPYLKDMGIECDYIKEAGVQHLNGGQALAYARNRYTGSDIDRGNRQREVLSAMFDTVKKMNPLKFPKLVEMILSECTTSLDNGEMLGIGMWALANSPSIESYGLPNDECPGRGQSINGTSYMVYDLQLASEKLHDFIYLPPKTQETSSMIPTSSEK